MKLPIVSVALLASQTVAFAPPQNRQTSFALKAEGLEVVKETFDPFEDYKCGESKEVACKDIAMGEGEGAKDGDVLAGTFTGYLCDSRERFSKADAEFCFKVGGGKIMPGLDMGVRGKKSGSKFAVRVPPAFAYGETGRGTDSPFRGGIPPNSDLEFDVEITKLTPAGPMAELDLFGMDRAIGMAACVAVFAVSPFVEKLFIK